MNNKKEIFVILLLITTLTLNAETPLISFQQYDNENDFVVETVGDGSVARITGYNGTKAEVRIPGQIRRMTVVAIGERAFYKQGFISVTIPNDVVLIGSEAFAENIITRITIGTNVLFHEDSFDSGFIGFYFENGRRAGTYVFNDGVWTIQTVTGSSQYVSGISGETHGTREDLKIFEIMPDAGFSSGIGLWDYGPSSLVPRVNIYLGMLTRISSFKMGLAGELGGFFGLTYPAFEDIGITYGFYFGSFMDFYFSNIIGFSLGGGMSKGYFNTKNDMGENYFFPFAEFSIMAGDEKRFYGHFLPVLLQ